MDPHVRTRTILISLVLVVALLHTITHFAIYGTGVSGIAETGISGLAIGNRSGEEIRADLENTSPVISPVSKGIVLSEWIILVMLIMGNLIMERKKVTSQPLIVEQLPIHSKSKTDLDALYDLLKEKKRLKMSVIAKSFNISETTANDWAEILETAKLATVNYPRFSESELVLNEKSA